MSTEAPGPGMADAHRRQGPEQAGTPQQNLELLAGVARDAAAQGTRLLICPEMFLTGYNVGPDAVRRLAEPAFGPTAQIVK